MFGRIAYVACVAGMTAAGAAQAQEGCWQSQEVKAAKVRDLQTMLMVGTLQCGSPGSAIVADYNRFVANNRQTLVDNNTVLKAYFMRTNGIQQGARAYDSFTTRLANLHSGSAKAGDAGFCQTTGAMAALAGSAPAADIEAMAEALGERSAGIGDVCAIAAAAPAAAAVQPVAAQTEGMPAVAAVVAAEPASPDQLQTATAALHAAVKALEAALAAQTLRAAPSAAVPLAAKAPAATAGDATQ